MPLSAGSSKEVISHNIEEMQAAGHTHAQSVAAALHNAKDSDLTAEETIAAAAASHRAAVDEATPEVPVPPAMDAASEPETELDVARLMRTGALPSPQRYHNIYLLRLRITGTGMAYRSMVGEHVYRDAALYLNDEMVARCNGLPVILEHPEKPTMEPGDFEKHVCGTIMLPFIEGENLEGIARIYALDAIERLEDARIRETPISTSPSVAFDESSENVKVKLANGPPLLIEGKPALIDHLAICGLGVWDKGGPASGITLDNEDLNMATEAEEKAKADAEKAAADKARADSEKEAKEKADAEEKAKADAARADSGSIAAFSDKFDKFADAMTKRMDAMEKEKADAAKADAEKEAADKAKKDAEDCSMADSAKFADAQAKADAVYSMLGEHAPRPMNGEAVPAYRVRLLKGLQKHSAAFKDSDLGAVARADSTAFAAVESSILADARKFAATPMAVADGQLQERTTTTAAGHRVTTFTGDPFAWMGRHILYPKRVRVTPPQELAARRAH